MTTNPTTNMTPDSKKFHFVRNADKTITVNARSAGLGLLIAFSGGLLLGLMFGC